jgi:hypothetical protein
LAQLAAFDGNLNWSVQWSIAGGDFSGNSIAVDSAGNSYVAGAINNPPSPLDINGILVEFGPTGDTVVQAQFFGNSGSNPTPDRGTGVALGSTDPNADVYVAGWTESPDFAPIVNACQPHLAGTRNGWIAKMTQPF